MRTRPSSVLVLIFSPLLALCSQQASADALFDGLPADAYLTGRFRPEKQPGFVRVDQLGIPAARTMYIRRDAGAALKRMYEAFRKDHPKNRFAIVSATRNFDAQRAIWDGKWSGSIKVGGKSLAKTVPDPLARGREILRFSSMPGTSRHHWGTDFDITSLDNSYFDKGPGKELLSWLERNGPKYGFCRPYSAGRTSGYQEERWHWSYRPVSAPLLKEWLGRFGSNPRGSLAFATFSGSDAVRHLAPIYARSINSDCL